MKPRGIDFTMKRRTTDQPLSELDKERNRLISSLRSPVERPHAVIKRVFRAGRVLATTIQRVGVIMIVTAFVFNLYQLCTLKMPASFEPSGSYGRMTKKDDEKGKDREINMIISRIMCI